MRTVFWLLGSTLLASGALLVYSLLYDATDLTKLFGLDPAGAEAIVVLVGLGVAATALTLGIRFVRRSSPPRLRADAG